MRILIVEDEKKMAEILKRGLGEEGYAVDVVYTGEDAVEMIAAVAYDLVVLDILLPGQDGLSVCRSIRNKKIGIPILMLTAKDSTPDKVRGLNSGADDYLTKPFVFEELYARVRALLRRQRQDRTSRLEAGDLVMDTVSREVWFRDRSLQLKGMEFSVLECLMLHPGIVVSRTMIEQSVRDLQLDTKYNLVDVYICKLRAKIEEVGGTDMIETVRGAGYRLKTR